MLADHEGIDLRLPLIGMAAVLFARTTVLFRIWRTWRLMSPLPGFVLVALFIWFGEKLGTAGHAWIHPTQVLRWWPVPAAKLGSWFLLMLISCTMVAAVMGRRPDPARE